jgi:leucyl/phenylalanyl-tRNA--protein transferase
MATIPWLDLDSLKFPSTESALAEPNGLLAVGGDLSPKRLIEAYRNGIFPWYQYPQPILWWSPNPRTVLFPNKMVISRSLKKRLRRGEYIVTCDQAFRSVVQQCAKTYRKGQQGTWISDDILEAYDILHQQGIAHSIESWHQGKLVGGLYGLAMGKVFFGESMFSQRTDASKVAVAYLARQLAIWNFAVIDCQVSNPHLSSLGAEELERDKFSQLLIANIDQPTTYRWPGDWSNLLTNPID